MLLSFFIVFFKFEFRRQLLATCNGNNSSGNETQFSKSRFAILEKLHKLRNWIKLLFLPSVAKRLPELSNEIIKYLKHYYFKKNIKLSNDSLLIYDYTFLDDYIFQVTLSISDKCEIVCYFDVILNGKKSIIADRFIINTFDDFIFLITKNMRSPLFIVN